MIRVKSLTFGGAGHKSLGGMEKHGKRQDKPSQMRCVRGVDPLVYGTLDLREAYDSHMSAVRTNTGMKPPVLHGIIKFPNDLKVNASNEKKMLTAAVNFINTTHGGSAVFAARLDRDEAGQHVVDVFYAPKYEKVTKTRKGEEVRTWWMSTTKHGKDLCEKHREEIKSRNDERKFTTGPRQVGIALQSELYDYLGKKGLTLTPKTPKNDPRPDRQETEAYKATKDAEEKASMTRAKAEQDAAAILESARAEGYAAGIAEASAEIHRLARIVETLKKAVWTFIAKLSPLLSQKQAEVLESKASDLLHKFDATADRLEDMSDPEEGYSSGPSL
tara:strand:- start:996 stop:1988 length:993 start_codon:yes stop_codon:yes gene_type:complete